MDFEQLLKKDRYQVFLFICPATMPFSFGRHPWFVINNKGSISRWEIFWRPQKWNARWGHLHKNFYTPQQGIAKYFFSEKFLWRQGTLLGSIEGPAGSLANRMVEFIESSPDVYPYCYQYSLKGPNSNTYVQWMLNQFPDCTLRLPWNSLGKKFAQQETKRCRPDPSV